VQRGENVLRYKTTMLGRINRITSEQTFSLILKKGSSLSFSHFRLKWVFSKNPYPRFGIVVSNKISKKAVVRNTIKRRLREIVRPACKNQSLQIDGIIFVKPEIVNASFQMLSKEMEYALNTLQEKSAKIAKNHYKYNKNK